MMQKNEVIRQNHIQMALAKIEAKMLLLPQADCPLTHEFADGVYCRKMFAKANTFVIGKRHRLRTLNILFSGEVTVYAGESMPVKRITAPASFTSDAMTKKLLFFHQDSVFANILPTTETDMDVIEQRFIIPEPEFVKLLEKETMKCLLQ